VRFDFSLGYAAGWIAGFSWKFPQIIFAEFWAARATACITFLTKGPTIKAICSEPATAVALSGLIEFHLVARLLRRLIAALYRRAFHGEDKLRRL
jgi:hypothetical protein